MRIQEFKDYWYPKISKKDNYEELKGIVDFWANFYSKANNKPEDYFKEWQIEEQDNKETVKQTVKKAIQTGLFKPIKGVDYRDGIQGDRGENGKDGKDGEKGEKGDKGDKGDQGEPGITGQDGVDGKDGSPDQPEEIRDKLESLEGENRLSIDAIKGVEKIVNKQGKMSYTLLGPLVPQQSGGGGTGEVTSVNGKKGVVTLTTTDIPEGSNLYWTEVRGDARYYTKSQLDSGQLDSRYYTISETDTLLLTKENLIAAGTTSQYWRGDKTFQNLDTSVVTENSNLYFTDERAQDAVGNIFINTSTINLSYNDGGGQISADVIQSGIDHGSISGLSDDDHTQYHTDSRGDIRYYTKTLLDGGQLDNRYYTETETNTLLNAKENISSKGVANGYASLDGSGKVPISQLPSAIMEYKGVWNANTNTPTLSDGTGDTGDVYRVSVAGSQNLGSGSITFGVGDYVIYNPSSVWEKSDTTDAISDINGLTGSVTISGTTNQINVSNVGGITLSTPQNIHTGAKPTFAGAILNSTTFGKTLDITANCTGEDGDTYGIYSNVTFNDPAQGFSVYGIYSEVNSTSSSTAYGLYVKNNATGAGNDSIGAHIEGGTTSLELVSTTGGVGLNINTNGSIGAYLFCSSPTSHGLYSIADFNYLSGKVAVRTPTTIPSANLHIGAGTATANTAPLKINAGTNLTIAEAGAIEFDGTDLFYTTSTPTRRTIVNLNAAQTLLNKKVDSSFQILETSDNTKKLAFDMSTMTTGVTTTLKTFASANNTITFPNATVTLVGTSETTTLSNKTLDDTTSISMKAGNFVLKDDTDTSKLLKFLLSGISAGNLRTLTIPNASGTLVLNDNGATFSNKILDNSNSITIKDNNLVLQDGVNTTKQALFELSGITASTTRTYTMPDANGTFALTSNTITIGSTSIAINGTSTSVAGLTLTTSTLTTPTLSNSTGTGAGVLGWDNTNKSLVVGDGTTAQSIDIGVWRTHSSTIGGFSGTPTQQVRYQKSGRTIHLTFYITGTSNATSFTFTLPIAMISSTTNIATFCRVQDNSSFGTAVGMCILSASSTTVTVYKDPSGTGWTNTGTKAAYGEITYET